MKNQEIKNKTAITFEALQTCNTNMNCETCLADHQSTDMNVGRSLQGLDCRWCAELGRCSDGTDRNRQDWLKKKCDSHNISQVDMCPAPGQVTLNFSHFSIVNKIFSQTFINYQGNTVSSEHSSLHPDDQQAKANNYHDKLQAGIKRKQQWSIFFNNLLVQALQWALVVL